MKRESLLSISEASQVLGVSEAALRQWTDERKVRAFLTPGGHRRYSRTELKRFINSQRKTVGMKDLVAELEEMFDGKRSFLSGAPWYGKLPEDTKLQLDDIGGEMLSLIIRCIADPSKGEDRGRQLRETSIIFGETLARLGLPLTDSVEAFFRHREPLLKGFANLMRRREAPTERVVESIPLMARVMDDALVALVASHQKSQKEANSFRSLSSGQGALNPFLEAALYSVFKWPQMPGGKQ